MHVTTAQSTSNFLLQQKLRSLAHQMRLQPTSAEAKLWCHLKGRSIAGLKFRRQHPLFSYIADFYCHELRLIIEVDGLIHQYQIPRDQSRDAFFHAWQYHILRLTNQDIMMYTERTIKKITQLANDIRATQH